MNATVKNRIIYAIYTTDEPPTMLRVVRGHYRSAGRTYWLDQLRIEQFVTILKQRGKKINLRTVDYVSAWELSGK